MNDAAPLPTPAVDGANLHRSRRRVRALRVALLVVAFPVALLVGLAMVGSAMLTRLPAYDGVPRETLSLAVGNVALDLAGEAPRFAPQPPAGPVPICPGVPESAIRPLRLGFGLMRGASEGRELFALLLDHDVCVRIDDLPYNAAYASVHLADPNDWSGTEIVVDRGLIRSGRADVLAAVLVHEATHVRRAIGGEACYLPANDTCTTLPNGVPLEEEVAAHAAEAEWWIAAFGRDGKRLALRADHGLNALVEAYVREPAEFRAFVADLRSDPREGDGF